MRIMMKKQGTGSQLPGSGSVTITGITTENETLTVTNSITDPNGVKSVTYQWQRDAVDITGATSNTYTLVTDDVGATITVVATMTDNYDATQTFTSSGVGPIASSIGVRSDTFVGTPGTPINGRSLNGGGTWTEVVAYDFEVSPAFMQISSGYRAEINRNGDSGYSHKGAITDTGSANGIIEFDFCKSGANPIYGESGALIRWDPVAKTGLHVHFLSSGIHLYEYTGGGSRSFMGVQGPGINGSSVYAIKVEFIDDQIKVFMDDVLYFELTHANIGSYTSTSHGIYLLSEAPGADPYIDNFVSTPVTGTSLETRFLLQSETFNGDVTFTDSSNWANNTAPTGSTITHQTTLPAKFGSSSIAVRGNNDTVQTDYTTNLTLGKSFTVDFWYYMPTSYDKYQRLVYIMDANNTGIGFVHYRSGYGGGAMSFNKYTAGSTTFNVNVTPIYGAWTHWAVTYDGSNIRIFRDGVHQATHTNGFVLDNPARVQVGAFTNNDSYTDNIYNIEEIRVRDDCVWTSNFTPPSAPYTL